jgi:activator of HSP90 ATPase
MLQIVQHSVILPTLPGTLYAMYLDPVQHAAFTGGGEVSIAPRVGAEFSAFGGRIAGRILALTPDRQIVQTWRSFEWRPDEIDSILVLTFQSDAEGAKIDLVQVSPPPHLYETLQANWPMRYFDPWRAYLARRR